MSKRAACRIDGIVAREAPVAVVFRRGPSKLTQLLTWNLENDKVTPGQWIKGKVYTRRCDVSPNGKYLIAGFTNYSARNEEDAKKYGLEYDWMLCGWTAISKPPYFTALALWFSGSAWNGGGLWESNTRVRTNNAPTGWHAAVAPDGPVKARSLNLGGSEDEPIFSMRMQRDGWSTISKYELRLANKKQYERSRGNLLSRAGDILSGDMEAIFELVEDLVLPRYEMVRPGLLTKPVARGELRFEQWLPEGERFMSRERWSIVRDDGRVMKEWKPREWHPQFLDVDRSGRIVFGDQGRLMAWRNFPSGRPKIVADLNDNVFEPVAPPRWATKW